MILSLPNTLKNLMRRRRVKETFRSIRNKDRFLSLILDVTNICNLRCRFCHFASDEYRNIKALNLSAEDFRHTFGPLLNEASMIQLSCGAEPLVNPHFVEILRSLNEFTGRIHFSTNAMLLDDDAIEVAVSLDRCDIAISIDGYKAETVEFLRKGLSFSRLLDRVSALASAKARSGSTKTRIVAAYTITSFNVDQITEFVPFAKDAGFDAIAFRMVDFQNWMPPEEWKEISEIDGEVLSKKLREAADEGSRAGIEVTVPEIPNRQSCSDGEKPAVTARSRAQPYCNWPYDHIFYNIVTPGRRRRMVPCPLWPDEPEYDDEADLEKAFYSPFFDKCRGLLLDDSKVPEWCQKCPIRLHRI